MKDVATILSILLLTVIASAAMFAQPGAISTNNLTGASTYNCTTLNDLGSFRQAQIQAGTSSSSVSWEFPATCSFPGDVWRPYSAGSGAVAFNTFVAPNGGTNTGALYNSGNGGSPGVLATTTSGRYYTFNVQDVTAPTNANMEVLETSFNPVAISTVSNSTPLNASNAVLVTVTTASAPSSGENVYVRYSTDSFVSSTLVQLTFSGSTGTAIIPCQTGGTTVAYYVYSSPKSLSAINTDVTGNGQGAHDMATLNLNNNSGSNYSYVQGSATNFSGVYNIPGTCYATLGAFVTALNAGTITGAVTCYVNAGYTETAPAGGFTITATGTVSNTITFQKFGTGTNPTFTAPTTHVVGSLHDAIFEIVGGDYITIDGFTMLENAANTITVAASNNMTEWGVDLLYATTTNGAQNCTIQNNTITLNRTYQNTFGIYSNSTHSATAVTTSATATTTAGGNSGLRVYGNTISNVNLGIVVVGPTGAADANTGIDIGGTGGAQANTITNFGTTGTFSSYANVSGTVNGILVRNSNGFNVSYNTVTSSVGGTTAGTLNGIQIPAASTAPTTTFTNTINNNNISLQSAVTAGAINGISYPSGSASVTSILNINSNNFNTFGHTIGGASGTITFITVTSTNLTTSISSNTFTSMTVNTTGSVTFISNSITVPAGGSQTINSNSIVTSFSKTGAGGTVTGITTGGSSTTVTANWNSNNFSNITVTGATAVTGINETDGGSVNHNIIGNTISNITGGTSAIIGINSSFGGANGGNGNLVSGNTISNISSAGAITGISIGSSGTTSTVTSNTIFTLASSGASLVVGITSAAPTSATIFKNKIYDLSNSNAGGTVTGLAVTAGTSHTVYNNLIGDLRATTATVTSPASAIIGINLTSTTASSSINVYYNTVYINATSSGTNFATTGIFHTTSATSTTAALNMRNNIITNLSTPNGTGFTVAYRRSSTTLTNFASTSNNNDLYVNTGAGTQRYFFSHGTTGPDCDSTIAAYRTRVSPRDGSSFAENPTFLSTTGSSPNFLHINTGIATQLESGASNIATFTDDYDAQTRQGNPGYTGTGTAPDIGADEFEGIGLDMSAPSISYATLGNSSGTTTRSFTAVTITDASGVNTTSSTRPRVFYKKSTDANNYVGNTSTDNGWKWVEANGTSSPFDFTIDYSLINGGTVTAGDVIQYFVVAQDLAATPNVGINSGVFAATPTSVALTSAAFPITGTINSYNIVGTISGTKTVGATGADYTTLALAVADLNSKEITGPVVFSLIDASYSETVPITINANSGSSATNTVTIKPTGTTSLSGTSTTGIIVVNGADYIIIDGSTGSTANTVCPASSASRDLTITNNSTGTTSAVIWMQTTSGADAATNNTIKNCNIVGNAPTTTLFGIGSGGTTISTSSLGTGNSNNSIVNNNLSKSQYGIYSMGASSGNKNQNNVINQNLINTASPSNVQYGGILVGFENNITISANTVSGMSYTSSTDEFGISAGFAANGFSTSTTGPNEVTNATITKNVIGTVTNSGTYSAAGLGLAAATSGTSTIANNMIYGVSSNGTSGDFSSGIVLGGGTGSTTNVYYNTVSMQGTISGATGASQTAACLAVTASSAPTLSIKNNIFTNTQLGNTGATVKLACVALGYSSTVGNYTGLTSDHNDFYAAGAGPGTYTIGVTAGVVGTNRVTLADWTTETGRDGGGTTLNMNPVFVTSSNLHIDITNAANVPLNNGATTVGVTDDIDCDTRATDIGADEFAFPLPGAFTLTAPSGAGAGVSGTLSWAASTNATKYVVYLDPVNNPPTLLLDGNVLTNSKGYSSLSQNTTYYWDVWAKTNIGDSVKASNGPFNFTTVTPPADPTGLAISNVRKDSLLLSWTDNAADGANSDSSFIVYRKAGSVPSVGTGSPDSAAIVPFNPGTGTVTYEDHGLFTNTHYFYRVSARNTQGESNYTSADSTTLAETPGAPLLTPGGHTMRVKIVPLSNPATTQFAIQFNDTAFVNTSGAIVSSPAWATYSAFGSSSGVLVTGLALSTSYSFDVKARNDNLIETGYGDSAAASTLGPMSGDYTVGVTMFNAMTGRNITFKPEVRRIQQEVLVPVVKKGVDQAGKEVEARSDEFTTEIQEVEEVYYVPMENGKPYLGPLYADGATDPKMRTTAATPGVYATITDAITDLNDRGVSGAVRFLLGDATYASETLPITVNQITGASSTNTIKILPNASVTTTISGSSASSVFKLNGADYFTFDGSNSGGTDQNMTITNTSTSSSRAAIWVASLGTGAGATNNTIKNCNLSCGANTSSIYGVFVGGTSIGLTGDDNDDLTIQHNNISKAYYGVYAVASATGLNNNLTISQNSIGSGVGGDQIGFAGIYVTQGTGGTISRNTVFNIIGTVTNPRGIDLESGFVNASVTRNLIHDIEYTGTGGYGGKGIDVNPGSATANLTIANNMLYNIKGDGWSTFTSDAIVGIRLLGTVGGVNIYNNSVNLTGTSTYSTSTVCAALYVSSTASTLDIRDNILANSIVNTVSSTGKSYAIYSAVANTAFSDINYNDYYASGTQGILGFLTSDRTTIGAWQTATGKDGNSFAANPLFLTSTNLHIDNSPGVFSPVGNVGASIGAVTTDYDGDGRSSTPDVGADEFAFPAPAAFTLISPNTSPQQVAGTLTWNKATGATRYDVYFDTNVLPTTLVANNVSDTTYTYSGNPSTTYYWNVYAENADSAAGARTLSSNGPYSFTTVAAPNSPSDLTLTTGLNPLANSLKAKIDQLKQTLASNPSMGKEQRLGIEDQIAGLTRMLNSSSATIHATWTDNATNEDSFFVYRKAGSAPAIGPPYTDRIAVVDSSVGSGGSKLYIDSPLDLNTHYYYRVTAIGNNIESGFSGADTTTLAETPGAPLLTDVQWSHLRIAVDPGLNPAPTEFAIKDSASGLYVSAAGTISSGAEVWQTYSQWGSAGGTLLTGLARGTLYTFNVKARNGAGVPTTFGPSASAITTWDQLATVLFEGFESTTFPPTGWQAVQNDAGAQNWARGTTSPHSGVGVANVRWESSSLQNDDWLITPLITLPTTAAELSFYYRAQSASWVDSFEVWISTAANGSTPAQFLSGGTQLYNNSNNNFTTYQQQMISLSAYAGQQVYLAWRYDALDAYRLYIDDVVLTGKVPPNTITVKKYRDHDGNLATTGDRTPALWHLQLHADSANGLLVGEVYSDTGVTVLNLLDGTYYAREADSTGWTHLGYDINGTTTPSGANTVPVVVSGGDQTKTVTFLNMKPNAVVIRKYSDTDGDFGTAGDRAAKSWHLALYRDSVSVGSLVSQANTESLYVGGLGDGTYIAAEADTFGWAHIGKIANGVPVPGVASYDTFVVSYGSTWTTDFVNARLNGIAVSKFRDANGGTPSFDVPKTWFMTIRQGSCSGPILASGNATTVQALNLPAGTYYVTEEDSSGWTHVGYRIDGGAPVVSTSTCVQVVLLSGQSKTVDFTNFHPNQITVNKLRDLDGDITTTGDQSPKQWFLSLHSDSVGGPIVASATNTTLVVGGLGDGTYYAQESDSSGWTHVGYILNGTPVSGSANAVAVTVSGGGVSSTISFANLKANGIVIRKYADADGNFATADRSLKVWGLSLYRTSVSPSNLVAQANAESLVAGGLGDGIYISCEADSAGWSHIGRISNGTPIAGTSRYDTLSVSDGIVKRTDFVNARLGGIMVSKFRDVDGGTVTFDESRTWYLAIHTDNCNGPVVASGNGATLTLSGASGGTYYVTEADSAGWVHAGYRINGGTAVANPTNCVSFTIAAGEFITVDFANFHPNSITVNKYQDVNKGSVSFDAAIAWGLKLKTQANAVIATDNDGQLVVTGLGDGTYTAVEADSTYWAHIGYRIDGGSAVASSDTAVSITVTNGQSRVIDFANALLDTNKFRTLSSANFATAVDAKGKSKAIKKKADKVEFSIRLVCDSTNINFLEVVFGIGIYLDPIQQHYIISSTPQAATIGGIGNGFKRVRFEFIPPLSSGDTVVIHGFGAKGKLQTVKEYEWFRGNNMVGSKKKNAVILSNVLRLPMPNAHNLGEEIYLQGGFGTTGMLVGVPHPENPKGYGWVLHGKYKDVQKSMLDKGLQHTGAPRCYDEFDSHKPLVKQQKSLPPTKHNNKLFASAVALKLNIAASALGKTPVGLGELRYHSPGDSLDGKLVSEISTMADAFLTNCPGTGPTAADYEYVINRINTAFPGVFDTLTFSSKLVMRGTVRVSDVGYLEMDPSIQPVTITPLVSDIPYLPVTYELYQNYPNPFNPSTMISFDLQEQSVVSLKIYNILGQEMISLLDNEIMDDGAQELEFNAADLPSGVYFYRLIATSVEEDSELKFAQAKKMILVK